MIQYCWNAKNDLLRCFYFMHSPNAWYYGLKENQLYVYDSQYDELDCLGDPSDGLLPLLLEWEDAKRRKTLSELASNSGTLIDRHFRAHLRLDSKSGTNLSRLITLRFHPCSPKTLSVPPRDLAETSAQSRKQILQTS